ncbi:MAG TPA: NUDIX domain-containing protein [Flavisolibacter sp.]|nr:NUDIX domain-containing protein [Flavisolibacter sp.]
MAQVNIKKEEVLSDEHYTLKKYTFDIQKGNGEWETQEREVFNHGNAATVLLYNPDEKTVLLTKQFRIATYVNGNGSGMLVETPAGLLEEGEAPEKTMLREIKEETGYEVTEVQKVYEAYSSAGAFTELIHFYVAPYSKQQKVTKGGGLEEEGEEIRVMEVPFEKAISMIESGEIKDAKTILLLLHAKTKGLL